MIEMTCMMHCTRECLFPPIVRFPPILHRFFTPSLRSVQIWGVNRPIHRDVGFRTIQNVTKYAKTLLKNMCALHPVIYICLAKTCPVMFDSFVMFIDIHCTAMFDALNLLFKGACVVTQGSNFSAYGRNSAP